VTKPRDRSLRQRTREELFELIRARGEVTRAELASVTGFSRSTINQSIGRLFADGRITEVDSTGTGPGSGRGRPATRLRAVASGAGVAGIDFGHSHVHVAVADALGSTIGSEAVSLDVDMRATDAIDIAATLLAELCAAHSIGELARVVAGIPGPLDQATGLVRSPTILSGWVGLAPASELQERIGIPVHVENDALLGAYGELHRGAGRGYDNFLYVKVSHGLGAGVVIGGELYRGGTGLAGEIGHTMLPGHSELCRCGNKGCLETVVSVQTVRDQIAHTRPGTDPRSIDLTRVDDASGARILDTAGRTLGRVLADLSNLLNPQALIIGGELGSADGPLIDGVRASINLHAQPATADAMDILPAALGTRAELTGALQLAALWAAR
jgi:predicted NBD/HSP70 family sugar kinase